MFVAGLMVGTHAGVSRQEARGEGGQDGDPGHPLPAALDPGFTALAVVAAGRARRARPTPGRTASARSSTPSPRRPGTTAAPSPASRANTPFYNRTIGFAMLIGRFIFIVPMLAVAGSLAAEEAARALGRHLSDPRPALRRPPGRRDPHHRRPHLLPGGLARPDRRAGRDESRHAFRDVALNAALQNKPSG